MTRRVRLPIRFAAGALAVFAAAWAPAAWGQGAPRPGVAAPRIRPLRDVVVTYRVAGQAASLVPGGLSGPVTLSWDAAGQRLRAEAEGRSQVALIDLRGPSGQVLDTGLRVVLPLPMRPGDLQPLTLEGARLVPQGRERIAGLACDAYAFESAHGPGSVCLTPDGVPLRGQGLVQGKPGSFAALAVQYGPVPSDRFTVPPGTMALGGGSAHGLAGLAQRLGGANGLNDLRGLLGGAR